MLRGSTQNVVPSFFLGKKPPKNKENLYKLMYGLRVGKGKMETTQG
jgi:hypothetical protein